MTPQCQRDGRVGDESPRRRGLAVGLLLVGISLSVPAIRAAEPVNSAASATEAARRLMKARCTGETRCQYRAERDGKQWRVWVNFARRNAAHAGARPIADGYVVLYFDAQGTLIRRVEGE